MLIEPNLVLPQPKPEEIREFKELYLKRKGIELTDKEAYDYARRALQLFCLATYCQPYREDKGEGMEQ